jgi:hypothetical protein
MDSNGNAYHCPRRLAPGWVQRIIYTNKQYTFDPSQTMVYIWRWTSNFLKKIQIHKIINPQKCHINRFFIKSNMVAGLHIIFIVNTIVTFLK